MLDLFFHFHVFFHCEKSLADVDDLSKCIIFEYFFISEPSHLGEEDFGKFAELRWYIFIIVILFQIRFHQIRMHNQKEIIKIRLWVSIKHKTLIIKLLESVNFLSKEFQNKGSLLLNICLYIIILIYIEIELIC